MLNFYNIFSWRTIKGNVQGKKKTLGVIGLCVHLGYKQNWDFFIWFCSFFFFFFFFFGPPLRHVEVSRLGGYSEL